MDNAEITKASARLIVSTKRINRPYSIWDIANDIAFLRDALGSMQSVAEIAGITVGMLNQFLSVFKLPDNLISLVKSRRIDSVSLVFHLSKLGEKDLNDIIELIEDGKLLTQDLRALIPQRSKFPNESISSILNRVVASKNVKVSVIKLPGDITAKSIFDVQAVFERALGKDDIFSISKDDVSKIITVKISKKGERELRKAAKQNKTNLQEYIIKLIND